MLFKASKEETFSSISRYLTVGFKREFHGTVGSLPNMRKKMLSFECLFGKKLYAAQA